MGITKLKSLFKMDTLTKPYFSTWLTSLGEDEVERSLKQIESINLMK